MEGLFIHDHKFPRKNDKYYNSYGFDEEFFNRYLSIFNSLSVIGRNVELNSSPKDYKGEEVDPKINFFTVSHLKELNNKETRIAIRKKIIEADYLVIRLPSILGLFASYEAKKNNKPYIIEVVGCAWDAIANKGVLNIVPATIITQLMKRAVRSAPYVVYVTEDFLEKRYPTTGKHIACSNVTLNAVREEDLQKRLERIESTNLDKKIVIGTCATIDVIYKGQQDVIEAISLLRNKGYDIEYQLVGGGNPAYLNSIAKKYNVENNVKIVGSLKHEDVFKWLEQIDMYVHPSKQEGLSRAIIEAMSKGCPTFGANAGGISELIDSEYIFAKGNVQQICKIFEKFNKDSMKEQAKKNHRNSKKYLKSILYNRRKIFFNEFIEKHNN